MAKWNKGGTIIQVMRHLKQFSVILLFTLLGEALHALIPLPIPAAIYGLVLLFLALLLRILRPEIIRETGTFCIGLLPLLFVAPLVGLAESFDLIRDDLAAILVVLVIGLLVTFGVSGLVAQALLGRKRT